MSKKYKDYKVDDFLQDELFVKWVLKKEDQIHDFWSKLMEEHPEKIPEINEASLIIRSMELKDGISLENCEFLSLYERIEESYNGGKKDFFHWNFQAIAKIAAIFVLAMATTSFWFFEWSSSDDKKSPVTYVTKSTQKGERLTVSLPDGSIVKLNAESYIKYEEEFNDSLRLIEFRGEAIFQVAKDKNKPFVVNTTQMTVTALGTAFNVNSYDQNSHSVTLIEGLVSVENGQTSEPTILNPGEKLQLSKYTVGVKKVDVENEIAWSEGILIFRDLSFSEVMDRLEKWYGVIITQNGSAVGLSGYEGKFKNKSLRFVLETLSFSSGFDYQVRKDSVEISFFK